VKTKTSGLSSTRLAKMHDSLLRHVEAGRLPGLVAAISRRGGQHVDEIGSLAFDRSARRDDVAGVPGRFGWDGAFSTSLHVDLREDMVGVLMAQCRPGALRLPPVVLDFWTSAYQAIYD
jgi:CubicO group peptidase (beta-lactamase class C family)